MIQRPDSAESGAAPPGQRGAFGLGPAQRLRARRDFELVYRQRCSVGDDLLVVYGWPNEAGTTRLGLSVSRKVGGAVARNRWKRRLREAFRLSQHDMPAGFDLIIIPRRAEQPTLDELGRSLVRLARRAADKAQRRRRADHA